MHKENKRNAEAKTCKSNPKKCRCYTASFTLVAEVDCNPDGKLTSFTDFGLVPAALIPSPWVLRTSALASMLTLATDSSIRSSWDNMHDKQDDEAVEVPRRVKSQRPA